MADKQRDTVLCPTTTTSAKPLVLDKSKAALVTGHSQVARSPQLKLTCHHYLSLPPTAAGSLLHTHNITSTHPLLAVSVPLSCSRGRHCVCTAHSHSKGQFPDSPTLTRGSDHRHPILGAGSLNSQSPAPLQGMAQSRGGGAEGRGGAARAEGRHLSSGRHHEAFVLELFMDA